jgi:branched-subunit amino acid aminotransferase/4-amino-4-deoxychorismate lyase
MILDIAKAEDIPGREKNLTLSELYNADEAFTTGTMGELTPILEVDGRIIGKGRRGDMTRRLQELHRAYAYEHGEPLPFAE